MKKSHQHRVVRTGKPFLQIPSLSMLSKNSFQKLHVGAIICSPNYDSFSTEGKDFLAIITAGSKKSKSSELIC